MTARERILPPGEKEALTAALRGTAADRAIVCGEPLQELLGLVRAAGRRTSITVLANEASDYQLAASDVRVVVTLAGADASDLVLWRPSGVEGKARQVELARLLVTSLRDHGRLLLLGHKRRGLPAQEAALEGAGLKIGQVMPAGSGAKLLAGASPGSRAERLADRASENGETGHIFGTTVRSYAMRLETAPSLFSRLHLDDGTRALLEHVDTPPHSSVLDLGCGYGPVGIGVALAEATCKVVLVDKDPLAIALSAKNILRNGVEDRAVALLSDGVSALPTSQRFDLVLTHFPLHIPWADLERLLTEARDRLRPGGSLIGVALIGYPVAELVQSVFRNCAELARFEGKASFRLLKADA